MRGGPGEAECQSGLRWAAGDIGAGIWAVISHHYHTPGATPGHQGSTVTCGLDHILLCIRCQSDEECEIKATEEILMRNFMSVRVYFELLQCPGVVPECGLSHCHTLSGATMDQPSLTPRHRHQPSPAQPSTTGAVIFKYRALVLVPVSRVLPFWH